MTSTGIKTLNPRLSVWSVTELASSHHQNCLTMIPQYKDKFPNNTQHNNVNQDQSKKQRENNSRLASPLSDRSLLCAPIFYGILLGLLSAGLILAIIIALWLKFDNTRTSTNEIPVGTILLYSGNLSTLNSATYRWLLCDGSEVSRSTYSDLFNVIGTTYGSGNSTDIFNLPDFRGRFPLGGNSSDTSQLVPGGNAFHVITVDEMPSHAHDTGTLEILINGAHTHSVTDPGHNHGGSTGSGGFDGGYGYAYAYNNFLASTYGTHAHSIPTGATGITIVSEGSHTHGIQGITGFNGSNQAIDMMPPYQTIHFIIRT